MTRIASPISLRSAGAEDLAGIADLWARSGGPTRNTSGVDEGARLLARDSHALIVAEVDDTIVGTLIVGWDGWRCHLYRMAVDESARRHGVGTALFNEAVRRARQLGATRIDAMVAESNVGAISYWESLGFELDTSDRRWSISI